MARISSFRPRFSGIQKSGISKETMLSSLRAQMAEVNYQLQTGLISKEEADMKLQVLESKIEAITNPSDSFEVVGNDEIPSVTEPSETENSGADSDNQDENSDYGKNDFYSIQAEYNKFFLHLH